MTEAFLRWAEFLVKGFELMPWVGYSVVVLVGLTVGSFLNVVILRTVSEIQSDTPSDRPLLSVFSGRSHCPSCHTQLRWYELIPVLSWLLAKARCRHCGATISPQYPAVEALTAALFVLVVWRFGWTSESIGYCMMAALLLALAAIDLRTFYLPDPINQFLLWSGIAFAYFGLGDVSLKTSVFGAMTGWVALWMINTAYRAWRGHDGIGSGDFVLMAGIGAWIGGTELPYVLIIASVISIVCLPLIRSLHRMWALSDDSNPAGAFPLGPGLAAGGFLVAIGFLNIF